MKLIDLMNQISKLLILSILIVPTAAFLLSPNFTYKLPLTILFYGIIVERVWFSLFTTKEGKEKKNTTSDWSLILVTYTYVFFLYALFFDFFRDGNQISDLNCTLGILFLSISYLIRYWSVFHLGEQWASHLEVGDKGGRHLIRTGPYSYVRHPIYTAAIVEFIGMQFVFGAANSALVLACAGIPSVIFRSFFEEKISQTIFGEDYLRYMADTGRFLPICKNNLNHNLNNAVNRWVKKYFKGWSKSLKCETEEPEGIGHGPHHC